MRKISNIKNKLLALSALLLSCVTMRLVNISCIFKELFGIACPGCGMTRATLAALSLNFGKAYYYHPLFWCLPLLLGYFLYDGSLFKRKWLNRSFLALFGVLFVAVWVLRAANILPRV